VEFLPLVTFVLALAMGVLSGMSGGGANFIVMPYYIAIGLTPAQALATSKLSGLGSAVGTLTAFKGKHLVDKRYLIPFMTITFVCALVAAFLIPKIDEVLFQKIIGISLLVLAPTLFINKGKFQPGVRTKGWIMAGFVGYTLATLAQTMVGSGLGTMINLVLMYLFGLGALQATATKRVTQTIQAVLLFVLLAIQGLVVWTHAIAGFIGASIGTHIGSEIALKRGVWFVRIMLAAVMLVSGVLLLL
jgi:uncharacterized protein